MDGELFREVVQGVKAVAGIEAFLILPMVALDLSIMTGGIGADELVSDTQRGNGGLKQSGQIPSAVGKLVSELKAIVGLDALHPDAPAGIPADQLFEEVGGRVGALLEVGGQEAQAGEFVNSGILEQPQLWVRDTFTGYHLHIHLDPLSRIGHLVVGLWPVGRLLFRLRKQAQLPHDPEQALWVAGVPSLTQTVPRFHHVKAGISPAHIPDQLQLCLCVLVGVVVWPPGLAGQGRHCPIPAGLPEVDIRPALVVLPAGTADVVFLRVLHQGLPICHVLCYALVHEGYGPLSLSCCPQLQL